MSSAQSTPVVVGQPDQKDQKDQKEEEGTKRVNVIFTKQQYDLLDKIAKMQGISLSDALRQAINISNLIVTANADPDTKILLEKGSKTQELKIVR